jgi:hypothetical protein
MGARSVQSPTPAASRLSAQPQVLVEPTASGGLVVKDYCRGRSGPSVTSTSQTKLESATSDCDHRSGMIPQSAVSVPTATATAPRGRQCMVGRNASHSTVVITCSIRCRRREARGPLAACGVQQKATIHPHAGCATGTSRGTSPCFPFRSISSAPASLGGLAHELLSQPAPDLGRGLTGRGGGGSAEGSLRRGGDRSS